MSENGALKKPRDTNYSKHPTSWGWGREDRERLGAWQWAVREGAARSWCSDFWGEAFYCSGTMQWELRPCWVSAEFFFFFFCGSGVWT
jgi:hypothetical protein